MKKTTLLLFVLALAGCSTDKPTLRIGNDGGGRREPHDGATPAIDSSTGPEVHKIDRAHLKDTGTAPFDYSDPALWACLPGNDPNECHDDLDATEFLKDNTTKVEKHVIAKIPRDLSGPDIGRQASGSGVSEHG